MIPKSLSWFLTLLLLTCMGCTKTFVVQSVAPSSVVYGKPDSEERLLGITDRRIGDDQGLSAGTLSVVVKNMEDEIAFLGQNLQTALQSRGINVKFGLNDASDLKINVYKYRIRNLRTTGFSPYWTFTTFAGDLVADGKSHRITFYFKRGKVPVWSFNEIEEPCYNVPVSLMVKEIASKINRYCFGLEASTEKVRALAQDINTNFNEFSFLKVLELGYTNNQAAIEPLKSLTAHEDSMVRVCAVSSLGVLGAVDQLDLLKTIYTDTDNIEKCMALKAIGDLDTPSAKAFLQTVRTSSDYQDEMIKEVCDLYLIGRENVSYSPVNCSTAKEQKRAN
jgi:hypothetical protein